MVCMVYGYIPGLASAYGNLRWSAAHLGLDLTASLPVD